MAQTNRICFRIIIEQRKGIAIVDRKRVSSPVGGCIVALLLLWGVDCEVCRQRHKLVISIAAWVIPMDDDSISPPFLVITQILWLPIHLHNHHKHKFYNCPFIYTLLCACCSNTAPAHWLEMQVKLSQNTQNICGFTDKPLCISTRPLPHATKALVLWISRGSWNHGLRKKEDNEHRSMPAEADEQN